MIFLTAAHNENEIILVEALRTYEEALGILLRKMIDEEHLLTNLESVMLATDEMLDQEGEDTQTRIIQSRTTPPPLFHPPFPH